MQIERFDIHLIKGLDLGAMTSPAKSTGNRIKDWVFSIPRSSCGICLALRGKLGRVHISQLLSISTPPIKLTKNLAEVKISLSLANHQRWPYLAQIHVLNIRGKRKTPKTSQSSTKTCSWDDSRIDVKCNVWSTDCDARPD
ncbi:hypothetical protein HZ326_4861 [Fusarium oxysporum f. sp. albedinis]|nr:hypothetical protein HZ326_4861 [Fusarium oxysporum f. sp. albedinis]